MASLVGWFGRKLKGGTKNKENKNVSPQQNDDVQDSDENNAESSEIGQRVKNIWDLDEKTIARYLTIRDWNTYKNIKRMDILNHISSPNTSSEVICQLAQNYTQIHNWVLYTILISQDTQTKALNIKRFIKIANELLNTNNLNAAHAIVSALKSNAIERMEDSWKKVSTRKRKIFQHLSRIFSEKNNYSLLYLHIKEQAAINNMCIPYMDLALKDFETFVCELIPNSEIY